MAISPFLVARMVEMSGIEPESERIDPRMSTSVVGVRSFAIGASTDRGGPLANPLRPESLSFARLAASVVRHSGFVTPDPATGQSTVRADVISLRRSAVTALAYAARGSAAY